MVSGRARLRAADELKEEQAEELTAARLKPWKGSCCPMRRPDGGRMGSAGEGVRSSVPGPETRWRWEVGTRYMSLELGMGD